MSDNIVKAPWKLKGSGYILLYRFNKDFIINNGFVPQQNIDDFAGGLGAVMIVDYKSSNVGPYSEILFIPGKFYVNGKKRSIITKIYVSTQASIDSGRANWAIPKEMANFEFIEKGSRKELVKIYKEGKCFFEAEFKTGIIPFPVSTFFIPFPLAQQKNSKIYYTNFKGAGIGRFCKVKSIESVSSDFPELSSQKPIMAVKVNPFYITFPEAKVE